MRRRIAACRSRLYPLQSCLFHRTGVRNPPFSAQYSYSYRIQQVQLHMHGAIPLAHQSMALRAAELRRFDLHTKSLLLPDPRWTFSPAHSPLLISYKSTLNLRPPTPSTTPFSISSELFGKWRIISNMDCLLSTTYRLFVCALGNFFRARSFVFNIL